MTKSYPYDSLVPEFRHAALEFETRRHFLQRCTTGLGALWLGALGGVFTAAAESSNTAASRDFSRPLAPPPPHFPPRAKRVIGLHMAGSPSQLELFEHKPALTKLDGQDCPQSLLEGKRFAFIRGTPKMLGPQAKFEQYGESRAWISEHLPHFSTIVDEV